MELRTSFNTGWFLAQLLRVGFSAGAALVLSGPLSAQTKPASTNALQCTAPAVQSDDPNWSVAQKRLGQGIAFFETRQYALAYKQIKSAIELKLPTATETAMAHKYLAFFYCIHKVYSICEQQLEVALTIAPGFDLEPSEKLQPEWRKQYEKIAARCSPAAGARETTSLAPAKATVRFDIRPWGQIWVNDKLVGATPPTKSLELEPGRYKIEVRNNSRLRPLVVNHTLDASSVLEMRHDFK